MKINKNINGYFTKDDMINFTRYVWYGKSLKDTTKGLLNYFDEWINLEEKQKKRWIKD